MNSRSVNDNLVNFSAELATTLNQLDSKEPLLSFPFDHLYACHSESIDPSQLDKEVEISAHCVVPHQQTYEAQRVASLERQNKKLKDLLIYHLDLIQQQNESMSKKEKNVQALKQENETLKSKMTLAGVERQVALGRHSLNPPPLVHVPVTATVTAPSYKTDVPSSSQAFYNTFNDLLINDESTTGNNSFLFNTDLSSPKLLDPFDLNRNCEADLHTFLNNEMGGSPILDAVPLPPDPIPIPVVVENKRQKKEPKPMDVSNEPKYTITTSSGNPKIQRNRKRPTGIGSFSRMPKTKPPVKPEASAMYDELFCAANKESKTNYGKSKISASRYGYTALQERMQLIEPTPTGEDPYQIGEAEMREQSPIPKLMLQKTNHGRMKICTDSIGGVTSTITAPTTSRRIYDTMDATTSAPKSKRAKLTDRYSASNMHVQSKKDSASVDDEPEIVDVEKTDNEIDWCLFTTNKTKETSLCDFSYGETSANLLNVPLDITKLEFPDFFEPSPVDVETIDEPAELEIVAPVETAVENTKKRGARTSVAGPSTENTNVERKRKSESKRGRKRALSSTAKTKDGVTPAKIQAKPRARRATRGKKTPVAGMKTKKLYHTCMGDPDLSWYVGLDPDIKKDDCDPTDNTSANVEVPRWREKVYDTGEHLEGTESLEDRVFEKRHSKPEAEERRQLRWHMRRIREQQHVERLRQRQRDPWGPNSSQTQPRGDYTVWPQPVRDLQQIEITNTLPVNSFGEELPDLPQKTYVLPWVRTSRALKRSKRSKTLH